MKINNDIVNFWKSLNEDLIKNNPFLKRVPQFYVKPKENSILFVGLNPSFQRDRFNDLELKLNPDNFFESKIEEIDVIKIAEFGKKSHDEKEETVTSYPSGKADLGIEFITERIEPQGDPLNSAGLEVNEGTFTLSSAVKLNVDSSLQPNVDIPLLTRYHLVKYMIRAY